MLRIFLIIAVVAGLGGLFGAYQTGEKIKTITSERDKAQQDATNAQTAEQKAKAEAKKSKDEAAKVKAELASTTDNLKIASAKATEQERRANDLEARLNKSEQDRVRAQQEISGWNALGIPIDQVKNQKEILRKTMEERDAFTEEMKIMARNNTQLQTELDRFKGKDSEVKLPPGLKGKVVAIDPKYNFVVLDIGSNQGLLERGKLAVSHEGKLVGRLLVSSVEPNRSIANVIAEWKQGPIAEGDTVFASYDAIAHP
jgi:DNA repair exonuclease SbcCD ATPase subunit